eukprot:Rhum_TRINITY_DN11338_c0_g1::Rhum_TRINITY_DN11338_c0_g1_i1::g.44066::m.44066/K18408/TDRD9; ATP-dependent RNA helicase TDRD9
MTPKKHRKRSKDVVIVVDPWWGDTEAASAAAHAGAAQCRRVTLLVCGGAEGEPAEVTLRATLRPAQRLSVEYVPLPDPALLLPPLPSGSDGDDEAVVAAYAAQAEVPLARAMRGRDGDGDDCSRTVAVLCSSLLRGRLAVAASASAAVSGGGGDDVASAAAWLRRRAAAASALLGSVLRAYGGTLPLVPHLPRVLRAVARCGGGGGGGFVGVEAGTGTGKSTLLPQAIVASKAVRGAGCEASTVRVAVAMPRRAAVLGVCAVVRAAARARASPLCTAAGQAYSCGVQAGYRVGGQAEDAEEANVLYTTTGSLLKELIAGVRVEEGSGRRGRRRPTLRTAYTHIVVDECHVASAETELLRELLFRCCGGGGGGSSGGPVVILMSATFRTSAYLSARFSPVGDDGDGDRRSSDDDDDDEGSRHPLLVLPSAPPFPVSVRHLDAVLAGLDAGDARNDDDDGGCGAASVPPPLHRLSLLTAWVARCVRGGSSVLVFLPGLAAIRQVGHGVAEAAREAGAEVVSVHGALQGGRERLARRAALAAAATPPPCPLPPVVVLATNSVELGVTLPDLDVVVDSCLERVAAGEGGGSGGGGRLETKLAPRAALRQRAGRVGRCRGGTVWRLVTADEEAALEEEAAAALRGGGVTESVVLDALAFSLAAGAGDAAESAEGLLGGASCAEAVEQAVARLEACGAVVSDRRRGDRCRHRVTAEGLLFQRLPLDPALGHFVLLGARLGRFALCAEAAAAAACGVFRAAREVPAASARLSPHRMCDGSHSDVVGGVNMLRAHLRRQRLRREGDGDGDGEGSDEGEEEEEGAMSAAEALRNAECRLRDIAAVFLEAAPEAALSFEYQASEGPVAYEDMLALSFLWSAAFVSKTAAFKAKDMTSRMSPFPSGVVKRHSVVCRASKTTVAALRRGGSGDAAAAAAEVEALTGSAVRRVLPRCGGASESVVEFAVPAARPATMWGRPHSTWAAERTSVGLTGHRGSLHPLFAQQEGGGVAALPFSAPVVLPAADLEPPAFWRPEVRAAAEPLVVACSEHGSAVLPPSVPGMLSAVLLLTQKLVDPRTGVPVRAEDALAGGGAVVAVAANKALSVDCARLLAAQPTAGCRRRLAEAVAGLRRAAVGGVGEPHGGALDELLGLLRAACVRPDRARHGFCGTASVHRHDEGLLALFDPDPGGRGGGGGGGGGGVWDSEIFCAEAERVVEGALSTL